MFPRVGLKEKIQEAFGNIWATSRGSTRDVLSGKYRFMGAKTFIFQDKLSQSRQNMLQKKHLCFFSE
jgi:hypothetical protein